MFSRHCKLVKRLRIDCTALHLATPSGKVVDGNPTPSTVSSGLLDAKIIAHKYNSDHLQNHLQLPYEIKDINTDIKQLSFKLELHAT